MTLQGVKQAGAAGPGGGRGHGGAAGSLLSLCGGGDSVSRMASLATWHPGVTILFAGGAELGGRWARGLGEQGAGEESQRGAVPFCAPAYW